MALTSEKYQQKRQTLVERTSLALNISTTQASSLLSIGRQQSVRINTLKNNQTDIKERLGQLDVSLSSVEWMDEGLFIDSGLPVIRDSELVKNGEAYIQNAASWLPVLALNPAPGENILDMCAAPGGKTSHIAQKAQNEAFITANDNSRPRLHKLQNNLQRLGVENVTFTLHDATRLSRTLEPESFDKILLDAPCSGEGMMQLDNKKDFESWSVAHIKRLQQLQKKLIVQAWQLLKTGGRLVYSTCTMAPEQNEAVLDYLLRHNEDVNVEDITWLSDKLNNTSPAVTEWNGKTYDSRVKQAVRLHSSPEVEAFFVVSLTKEEV
jgi:16S rRNA (cytosine1407-C5)-methyltransferase